MFKKIIVVMPNYEFEGLNENQYKALQKKMLDYSYENFDYNDKDPTHNLSSYGAKMSNGTYLFCLTINTARAKINEVYSTDGSMNDVYVKIRQIIKQTDEVAEELEKIIEEYKEVN